MMMKNSSKQTTFNPANSIGLQTVVISYTNQMSNFNLSLEWYSGILSLIIRALFQFCIWALLELLRAKSLTNALYVFGCFSTEIHQIAKPATNFSLGHVLSFNLWTVLGLMNYKLSHSWAERRLSWMLPSGAERMYSCAYCTCSSNRKQYWCVHVPVGWFVYLIQCRNI